jgi:hypothetical protein
LLELKVVPWQAVHFNQRTDQLIITEHKVMAQADSYVQQTVDNMVAGCQHIDGKVS